MSKAGRTISTIITTIFFCTTLIQGSDDSLYRIAIPLDGSNTSVYNIFFPWDSWNSRSTVIGKPFDRFPHSRIDGFDLSKSEVPDASDTAVLCASASIGAEIGEPLLNKLDDSDLPNRDHLTLFETSLDVPKVPLRLLAGYRYVDTYSDRFDSLWADYSARVPGPGPAFSSEGLAHEAVFVYGYEPQIVSLNGSFTSYGYWGVTPYYYSPLHTRGYRVTQSASKQLSGIRLAADLGIDLHDDYLDPVNPKKYRDWSAQAGVIHEITPTARFAVSLYRNTKIRPRTYAEASVYDTAGSDRFRYAMYARAFSNFKTGFGAKLTIPIPVHRGLYGDARAAWRYRTSPRDYSFYHYDTRVEYRSREWHQRLLHFGLRFDDRRIPAFKGGPFYSFIDEPAWERVDTVGPVVTIRQDTLSDAGSHHLGIAGHGTHRKGRFQLKWNASGAVTPGDDTAGLPFEVPWRVAVEMEYGAPKYESARVGVRAEIRDRVLQRYYMDNLDAIETREAPSRATIALYAKLPFHSPFFREHAKPWIVFEAHPITVPSELSIDGLKDQRRRSHPGGNYRGPLFLIRLEGVWR